MEQNNIILFSQAGRLYRVSATGGVTTQLAQPDKRPGAETVVDTWPQFLPDGRHFLFCVKSFTARPDPARSGDLSRINRFHQPEVSGIQQDSGGLRIARLLAFGA